MGRVCLLVGRVEACRTRQKISCQCRKAGRNAEKLALTKTLRCRTASNRVENFLPMSKRVEQCRKQQNAVSGHTRLATAFFVLDGNLQGAAPKNGVESRQRRQGKENKNSLSRKQGRSPILS